MKFRFDKKAKQYFIDNKIKNIVIEVENDNKNSCCGLGSVDFNIYTNSKEKIKNFKKELIEDIEVYYEPALSFYFDNNEEILIKILRFLTFRKLYIANEVNVLK